MSPQYSISRELRTVTFYPANLPSVCNREAFAIDLSASDLIRLLGAITVPTTKPRSLPLRLWNRLVVTDTDCWEWTGSRNWKGYGELSIAKKRVGAHRLAWMLANQAEIPKGMDICHHCDNPPCCNPAHLFMGTRSDNVRDMFAKGRGSLVHAHGEKHGCARLSAAQVREIRLLRSGGQSASSLATAYGMSKSTIYYICSRRRWASVTNEAVQS